MKTRFAAAMAVIAFGLGLIGCGGPAEAPTESPEGAAAGGAEQQYIIGVAPKGLVHEFWLTVKAGAESAAKEHGADIIWAGPAEETQIAEQINIIEDMISKGVDAIVMAACDQDALIDVIDEAAEDGIPVVTIDSGVRSDTPISFIATNNIAGAREAADALAEAIGGEGKVGLLPFVPGAATSEMREQGFKEGMAAYPDIEIVSVLYSESDVAKGMTAVEDMMTANPDLDGVFAANESGAMGAVQALEAAGKSGEIKLVAFDASPREIEALKEGTIDALIVQNPYQMGYLGVKTAIDHLEGRPVEDRIDTGVTVVTRENLDEPDIQQLLHPLK